MTSTFGGGISFFEEWGCEDERGRVAFVLEE